MKKELEKAMKQLRKDIKESVNLSWYVDKIRTDEAGRILVHIKKDFITQQAIKELDEVAKKNNLLWYIELQDVFGEKTRDVYFHER